MNTNLGLIGKKLGNTQIFEDDGLVRRVTVIQAGPCRVLGKRTVERDGYVALQLGFGKRPDKRVRQPELGFFRKLEVDPVREICEFRVTDEVAAKYEVGQELSASDLFEVGQLVDVSGTSKGRGFAGVMKRHGFKGAGTVGHGAHEVKRHGGSIGMNMTPGRTLPGQKMAGQMGNKRVTVLNLRVARVLEDDHIILVEGAVPGSKDSIVTLRAAVKKRRAAAEA